MLETQRVNHFDIKADNFLIAGEASGDATAAFGAHRGI
jgi:hypothetical protein